MASEGAFIILALRPLHPGLYESRHQPGKRSGSGSLVVHQFDGVTIASRGIQMDLRGGRQGYLVVQHEWRDRCLHRVRGW